MEQNEALKLLSTNLSPEEAKIISDIVAGKSTEHSKFTWEKGVEPFRKGFDTDPKSLLGLIGVHGLGVTGATLKSAGMGKADKLPFREFLKWAKAMSVDITGFQKATERPEDIVYVMVDGIEKRDNDLFLICQFPEENYDTFIRLPLLNVEKEGREKAIIKRPELKEGLLVKVTIKDACI